MWIKSTIIIISSVDQFFPGKLALYVMLKTRIQVFKVRARIPRETLRTKCVCLISPTTVIIMYDDVWGAKCCIFLVLDVVSTFFAVSSKTTCFYFCLRQSAFIDLPKPSENTYLQTQHYILEPQRIFFTI